MAILAGLSILTDWLLTWNLEYIGVAITDNIVIQFNKISNMIRSESRLLTNSVSIESPVVTVKEGKLRGAVKKLCGNLDYYSFKGIPYAQPPVGKLRFKAPRPLQPWDGIRDSTEHGSLCPQVTPSREILEGDENCLYLNVYTRSLKNDSRIPVMVYIHGGSFTSGSGNDDVYGPEFLLNHDVILVTINYRLEAFGFLSLDTPEVPGNAGLKDQVEAFRWIQRNISYFGGDPENVTIFGSSAGASSVTYHMLSSMSKGLFSKAISQSGVCLNDWAVDIDAKTRAFRVGKVLGMDTNDTEKLLEFLQSVPAREFIGMNFKVASDDEKHRGLPIRFGPVVEKTFRNNEAFLTEKPLDLLVSGKFHPLPFIVGYNTGDGMVTVRRQIKKVNFTNNFPSFLVPKEIVQNVSLEKLNDYGERIKLFYCGDKDLTAEDVDIISDMQTDLNCVIGIYRMANLYSVLCNSIYMYRFNLSTELNIFKLALGLSEYKGACHVDELFYMFKNYMNTDNYEKHDRLRELVHMITKIWTDFAKTGNPTPDHGVGVEWTPYTSSNKECLSIDDTLEMVKIADRKRLEFWTKLYEDAGLPFEIKSSF